MFCPKCGSSIPENDHYCPTCGEPNFAKNSVPDECDRTANFDPEDAKRVNVLSALCYVSFAFIIIALLLEPNSKFLRYHINQSILLTVFGFVVGVAAIIPLLGWIASAVGAIMAIIFTVMGIVHAFKCEAKDLPIIGKYIIVNYD